MDLRLALMTGIDIPIPECQAILHQPKINEIAFIGEEDFFAGVQTLCLKKSMITQDENVLANTSNFQIFMTVMQDKTLGQQKKKSVIKVLELLFPNYASIFTPRSLILQGENGQLITIDSNNFEALQEVLSQVFCISGGNSDMNFNPEGKQAQEIADKLMRARQRVAKQKNSGNGSVFVQYLSTLTIGIPSMSLQDLCDLTMFQFYDLIERYSLWVNWDVDLRARLAGGSPDSKPDNWMKNIH